MSVCMYEGYLRNRKALCEELSVTPCGNRRETERSILAAGYKRWGRDLVHHLYGAFSLALWDEERQELFCARDHFGIQPFFYYTTEDGTLLFGACIREIIGDTRYKKAIDRQALQIYMCFGYAAGEKTLWAGIRKLMPGCILIRRGKNLRTERYYVPSFRPDSVPSEQEWTERIDRMLQEILREDRENFDPRECGAFLSGGVDSAYLLASSGAREAYGAGFRESAFNESAYASRAAEALGASFHEILISPEEYFDAVPCAVRNTGLPLADPSAPSFALACAYAGKRTRACYSGEGADEFFAGYHVYRRAEELGADGAAYYGCSGVMEWEKTAELLGSREAAARELLPEPFPGTMPEEPLSRMLAVDTALWLEGSILPGAAGAAAANGICLLLPYMDRRMFECSAAIPASLKLREDTAKYILRKSAEKRIPREFAYRPKAGFPTPAIRWFREERFRPALEQKLFGSISADWFEQPVLRNYWKEFLEGEDLHWKIIYAVYAFVVWMESCFQPDNESYG